MKKLMDEFIKYHDNTTTNGGVYKMKLDAFTAGFKAAGSTDNSEIDSLTQRIEALKQENDQLTSKVKELEQSLLAASEEPEDA